MYTHAAGPVGIDKSAMSRHMVPSSCAIHLCIHEVRLCDFNLSVNEMLYQSRSEQLLS